MQGAAFRTGLLLASALSLGMTTDSSAAVFYTRNFTVHAPTYAIAKQAAQIAEEHRRQLAQEWFNQESPQWDAPCQVTIQPGAIQANGFTSFTFRRGKTVDLRLTAQGPLNEIYEAVLPHEMVHMLLATHFGRPVPRWADEGAALLAEGDSAKLRKKLQVDDIVTSDRRIPLRQLLSIHDYPPNFRKTMAVYAQGYSLAEFLIERGGKSRFIELLAKSYRWGWDTAFQRTYGFDNVESCEHQWDKWLASDKTPATDGSSPAAAPGPDFSNTVAIGTTGN